MPCPTTVNETVCVGAQVTISPQVTVGAIQTFCVGDPVIGPCAGTPVEFCSFEVSQHICVQVPLTFHANAVAEPTGLVCGTPNTGGCQVTTGAAGDTPTQSVGCASGSCGISKQSVKKEPA